MEPPDLDYATLDYEREERTGVTEVVYAEGKTAEQVFGISELLLSRHGRVLATRCTEEQAQRLSHFRGFRHAHTARIVTLGEPYPSLGVRLKIVSAGTSDLPVAEEALLCARWFGLEAEALYDLGVAGIHRTLRRVAELREAEILIVVAGMEGALASVVGGLVSCPVIAVPTSVGYGTHLGGLAPLLSMLNSCASGITVVNVDNGFGAAMAARRIAQTWFRRTCE